jgi:hypothetical protein
LENILFDILRHFYVTIKLKLYIIENKCHFIRKSFGNDYRNIERKYSLLGRNDSLVERNENEFNLTIIGLFVGPKAIFWAVGFAE